MKEYYNARQHIRLSSLAYDIVEADKYEFMSSPSRQGFINQIIESFADDAQASIDTAVSRYRDRLEQELAGAVEGKAKTAVLAALTDAYCDELIQHFTDYPKDHSFKFQLNERNFLARMSWTDIHGYYGGHPSRYYSAMLEEYARKSYFERESIALKKLIDQIQLYIDSSKLIVITLGRNETQKFEVRPYAILPDSLSSFHYLVGFAKPSNSDIPEKIFSCRISRIKSVEPRNSRSGKITADQKNLINERIQTVGLQFLLHDPEFIRVKLTESGIKKYESQVHLRPPASIKQSCDDGTWIYSFDCTQRQAELYFFKFGADAEILAPDALRKRFLEKYLRAVDQYM